ncbi:MAG: CsgG/HfaB family protein [Bacteroidota bacterium]|nr:CsgG/HfaB family protein [Bacteroidota bacterium]
MIKNKVKLTPIFLLAATVLFNSCAILKNCFAEDPEILLKTEFDKSTSVAVLDFSKHGSSISSNMGRLAADKLSEKMFLSDSFKTVERSRVNEAVSFLAIKSTEELSADDIQKLGLRLKANYLVLGNITNNSQTDYLTDKTISSLLINFRIISVLNSDVVGVINYSADYDGSLNDKMDDMMNKIVKKLNR